MKKSYVSLILLTLVVGQVFVACDEPVKPTPPDPEKVEISLNPLSYVAEYNLGADGKFVSGHQLEDQYYFSLEQAKNAKKPEGYHLPTIEELGVILAAEEMGWDYPKVHTTKGEKVTILGNTLEYKGEYLSGEDNQLYAIRFINDANSNLYRTAYRYNIKPEDGNGILEVTARHIGNDAAVDLQAVMAKGFFDKAEGRDVVTRIFPLAGSAMGKTGSFNDVKDDLLEAGEAGAWRSTTLEGEDAYYLYIGGYGASSTNFDNVMDGLTIRLIKDNK